MTRKLIEDDDDDDDEDEGDDKVAKENFKLKNNIEENIVPNLNVTPKSRNTFVRKIETNRVEPKIVSKIPIYKSISVRENTNKKLESKLPS